MRVKHIKPEWKISDASGKYQMRVENIRRSEKYQTRVKSIRREWKVSDAREKRQSRVKNNRREWKMSDASEKYQTGVKNIRREWNILSASEKYQTRVNNIKMRLTPVHDQCPGMSADILSPTSMHAQGAMPVRRQLCLLTARRAHLQLAMCAWRRFCIFADGLVRVAAVCMHKQLCPRRQRTRRWSYACADSCDHLQAAVRTLDKGFLTFLQVISQMEKLVSAYLMMFWTNWHAQQFLIASQKKTYLSFKKWEKRRKNIIFFFNENHCKHCHLSYISKKGIRYWPFMCKLPLHLKAPFPLFLKKKLLPFLWRNFCFIAVFCHVIRDIIDKINHIFHWKLS